MNGASSGLLLCQNTGEVADWTRAISANIATVNAQAVSKQIVSIVNMPYNRFWDF